MANENFDKLAKAFFDYHMKSDPILATSMGIHKYDHLLPDESREFYTRDTKRLKQFLKRFQKINENGLTFDRRVDRLLAIHILKLSLWDQEKLKSYEQDVDAIEYLGDSLFTLFSKDFAPYEKRLKSIVSRIEKSPKMLMQFRKRIRKPVRIWTEIAIESCEEFPSFLNDIIDTSKRLVKNRKLLERLESAVEKCKIAVNDYKAFLKTNVLPKATHPFYLGDKLFAELIELRELEMTPDEILEFGRKSLKEEQRKMREIAKRIDPKLSTKEVLEIVQSHHFKNFDKILDEYRETCAELKVFTKRVGFATIPERERLIVKATPSFLIHTIPFAAYFPPAKFDKEQIGIYIVTPPQEKEDFKKYSHGDIRNTCVHEAYPGHHLQLAASNSHKSLIRALVDATEFVEGWAFYCEDMAVEMGYDPSIEGELMKAYGMVWRAARIVVDVLLSTGKMTFDEAVDFMVKEVGMIRSGAVAEVKRYTQSPSYQLSYYLGKYLIKKLRSDVKAKFGSSFDIRRFHDTLLYNGSLPIKYHRMILEHKLSKTFR